MPHLFQSIEHIMMMVLACYHSLSPLGTALFRRVPKINVKDDSIEFTHTNTLKVLELFEFSSGESCVNHQCL